MTKDQGDFAVEQTGKSSTAFQGKELRPAGKIQGLEGKAPGFQGKDAAFALVFWGVGFAYVNWLDFGQAGAGTTWFTGLFLLVVGAYLRLSGRKAVTRASWGYLALVILSALPFILLDQAVLNGFLFLYLSVMAVYWVAVSTGRRIFNGLEGGTGWDLWNQLVAVPFTHFFSGFASMGAAAKKRRSGVLVHVLMGLLLCIPVLAVVLALLSGADPAFSYLMGRAGQFFSMEGWYNLEEFLLGIPVACYLFGLVWGNIDQNGNRLTKETIQKRRERFQMVPLITVKTALSVLCLVYAVFLLSQTGYLFSAFRAALPEAMTYSEYARQGFFQLCMIAGINLISLAGAALFAKEGGRKLRGLTIGLSGLTLLLILTATSKMVMYIHYYGLTQLRVYTTWFMAVLFFCFCMVIACQIVRFNGAKVVFLAGSISFLLLCYINVDGGIAAYNIDRYEAGTLKSLNAYDYDGMSGAVPQLASLYHRIPDNDPKQAYLKQSIYEVIVGTVPAEGRWYDGNPRHYSRQAAKAQQIADQMAKDRVPSSS